jgi:hypothetical protein
MKSHEQEENAEFCTIYSNNVCDVNSVSELVRISAVNGGVGVEEVTF